jgi:hypothetical protein
MQKLGYIFLLILPLLASCTSPRLPHADLPTTVSAENYERFHRSLLVSDGDSRGFTHTGTMRYPAFQHDQARDIIISHFDQMGYSPRIDPFSFQKYGSIYTNCSNVIAIKSGTVDSRIHIIGAHYDTVDAADGNVVCCPGADDNGSGVAALLEIARAVKSLQFRDTIVFVAFDAEENGSYATGEPGSPGALHFVKTRITDDQAEVDETRFYKSSVVGMISIDMIGYDDPVSPPYVVIGRKSLHGSSIGNKLERAVETYTGLIPYESFGYGQSDHTPFHQAGIDAVHLLEYDFVDYWHRNGPTFSENPHYHSDSDSIDTPGYISYAYATEITRALVGYLCDQAGLLPNRNPEE